MDTTTSFYKAAKVSSRRHGWIFRDPKFDMGQATPLVQKPRVPKYFRKPKWMK